MSNIFVGFEGGVGALYGGVCMAMYKMTEIVEVNQSDFDATVRAGVTRHQLNDWIRADGLHFPIDPGKWEHCILFFAKYLFLRSCVKKCLFVRYLHLQNSNPSSPTKSKLLSLSPIVH